MRTETLTGQVFDRASFEAVLTRRMFFVEAFEIYRKASNFKGNTKGLFDYGPPGCGLQTNIVDLWRKHFIVEEDMLELDCTVLTPEDVFKTSGHVDRFADWMCKDPVEGDYLRADHLVEAVLQARLDADQRIRGLNSKSNATESDPKKKMATSDATLGRLEDSVVKEYEEILAKVCFTLNLIVTSTSSEYLNLLLRQCVQIDNYDGNSLGELIERFDIRNPNKGGKVLPPVPFNLMFKSTIGPGSATPVYLRPETAQGQFLNFKRLMEYNQNSLPFASASVGKSYRNEISPRSGLLRVREFLMAEIEHFVDPDQGKRHARFQEVRDIQIPLLDKATQLEGRTDIITMSVDAAVQQRIIDNETLGYFLIRIQSFLEKMGIDRKKMRFRQHLPNEMAHYACDCWDTELLTSYGWIECVGCADRSAYDLTVHMNRTKEKLVVRQTLPKPQTVTEWQPMFDKRQLGKVFREDALTIQKTLSNMSQDSLSALARDLAEKGRISIHIPGLSTEHDIIDLEKNMISIDLKDRVENIREYIPNVIEPSFGIGRILYCLLEHTYWYRPDDIARAVFSLPLSVAPIKVLLLPLSATASFNPTIQQISGKLRRLGITTRVDASGASIGKRYARNDELGIPLGITIDFDTVKDGSVTLRERDSTEQVRGPQDDILSVVENLVNGREDWLQVLNRFPRYMSGREE